MNNKIYLLTYVTGTFKGNQKCSFCLILCLQGTWSNDNLTLDLLHKQHDPLKYKQLSTVLLTDDNDTWRGPATVLQSRHNCVSVADHESESNNTQMTMLSKKMQLN